MNAEVQKNRGGELQVGPEIDQLNQPCVKVAELIGQICLQKLAIDQSYSEQGRAKVQASLRVLFWGGA